MEQHSWDKERSSLLQGIQSLKQDIIKLQHIDEVKQTESLIGRSLCKCSYNQANIQANNNSQRVPLKKISQCYSCRNMNYENTMHSGCSRVYFNNCNCYHNSNNNCSLHRFEEKNTCECFNNEDFNDSYLNPLLTEESRHFHQKFYSIYSNNDTKRCRNSQSKRGSCDYQDSKSLNSKRNASVNYSNKINTSYNNCSVHTNIDCDSSSCSKTPYSNTLSRNQNLNHSKSFTNILKSARLNIDQEKSCENSRSKCNNAKSNKGKQGASNISIRKKTNFDDIHVHNQSIQKLYRNKNTLSRVDDNRQSFGKIENFDKRSSNNSLTHSSFNDINCKVTSFGPPSSISEIPENSEEEILNSPSSLRKAAKTPKILSLCHLPAACTSIPADKYKLTVETTQNCLLLSDICEAAHSIKLSSRPKQKPQVQPSKISNSPMSSKNRTVSINLYSKQVCSKTPISDATKHSYLNENSDCLMTSTQNPRYNFQISKTNRELQDEVKIKKQNWLKTVVQTEANTQNQHLNDIKEKDLQLLGNDRKKKVDMSKYMQDKTRNQYRILKELNTIGCVQKDRSLKERREVEMQSRLTNISKNDPGQYQAKSYEDHENINCNKQKLYIQAQLQSLQKKKDIVKSQRDKITLATSSKCESGSNIKNNTKYFSKKQSKAENINTKSSKRLTIDDEILLSSPPMNSKKIENRRNTQQFK